MKHYIQSKIPRPHDPLDLPNSYRDLLVIMVTAMALQSEAIDKAVVDFGRSSMNPSVDYGKREPSPWIAGLESKAAPLLASGLSLKGICSKVPEIKNGAWNIHKNWCLHMGLDPYSCNYLELIPDEEKQGNIISLSEIDKLNEYEHLFCLLEKNVIEMDQIIAILPLPIHTVKQMLDRDKHQIEGMPTQDRGLIKRFYDGMIICVKPVNGYYPPFVPVPSWHIPRTFIEDQTHMHVKELLAARWKRLYPGHSVPVILDNKMRGRSLKETGKPEKFLKRLTLGKEKEAFISGLIKVTDFPTRKANSQSGWIDEAIKVRVNDLALYSDRDKVTMKERYKKKESFNRAWNEALKRWRSTRV